MKGIGRWIPFTKVVLMRKVSFEAIILSIANDGIGAYEYWGAKCIDLGRDYVEEFDVRKLKYADTGRPLVGRDRRLVLKAIDTDPLASEIMDELGTIFQKEEDAREEADWDELEKDCAKDTQAEAEFYQEMEADERRQEEKAKEEPYDMSERQADEFRREKAECLRARRGR